MIILLMAENNGSLGKAVASECETIKMAIFEAPNSLDFISQKNIWLG